MNFFKQIFLRTKMSKGIYWWVWFSTILLLRHDVKQRGREQRE